MANQCAGVLGALRGSVQGRVLGAADEDYQNARRVWNGMIDRHPLAIVQASGIADIAPTIALARDSGLALAIRGGGHGVAGYGTVDDGIVLDLALLRAVDVDAQARLVTVGAGATLGDIDRATEPHRLAVPIGVVSGTGIAGLTLGGGIGWLTRPYGLTIDNLVAADVVLATGELVRASESEHPDLFWGLRGGGGNFGVVASFTFRAHPLDPDVFAGTLIYERPRWGDALRAFLDWTVHLPEELTTLITFMVPPPDWDLGDRVLMFLGFAWAGRAREHGMAQIERLQARCRADVAVLDPTRWIAFQSAFDLMVPKGVRAYWRNASFSRLDDAAIETIVDHCGAQTWYGTAADLHHMGGAFGRVPEEETAFPDRSAQFWLNVYGFWPSPDEDAARIAWVKGFSDAMRPHSLPNQYVNFLGADSDDPRLKALAAYGPSKLERLIALKRRYDPTNVFRINHNLPPGLAGETQGNGSTEDSGHPV
ncbi:MAG TPA: FAD-binding oxidoreductase [Candidatus Limnocylindrales bacterium]|nr:FAD-binding oxidoreductase [Candidatus Limnocylindrales bacterium]